MRSIVLALLLVVPLAAQSPAPAAAPPPKPTIETALAKARRLLLDRQMALAKVKEFQDYQEALALVRDLEALAVPASPPAAPADTK